MLMCRWWRLALILGVLNLLGGSLEAAPVYEIVRSGSLANGANIGGDLTLGSDGNFYGVAQNSGTFEEGTLFKMTPAGAVTLLVDFATLPGATHPYYPRGGLVLGTDGNFYGTTSEGGSAADAGTVFRMTPGGAFTVMAAFRGQQTYNEGDYPVGRLVRGNDGAYYGITRSGGTQGAGTAFRFTLEGGLTYLTNFGGGPGSEVGTHPEGGLTLGTDGNFYGVTSGGGTKNYGTVFRLTPAGVLTTLHSFQGGGGTTPINIGGTTVRAGGNPYASLTQVADGNFYGTTVQAGGTVFRITPAGAFTVLGLFTGDFGSNPGSSPQTRLLLTSDGNLYGTTTYGGYGKTGSIFRLSPSGLLTTVVEMTGESGSFPGAAPGFGGLFLGADGKIYGTAEGGGTGGGGVVFRLTFDTASETLAATEATTSSLKLNGTVNPNNLSTTVTFEYGTTSSLGSETAPLIVNGPNGAAEISTALNGLTSGATIHYRIKAVNDAGTQFGMVRTGQTIGPPLGPSPLTVSAGASYSLFFNGIFSDVTIHGTLLTNGRTLTVNGTLVVSPSGTIINNGGKIIYKKRSGLLPPGRIALLYDIANDAADDDGDGRCNLLEFALGSDPSTPDSINQPSVTLVGSKLRLTYVTPAQAEGLVFFTPTTGDFVTWDAPANTSQIISDSTANEWRTVVVEDTGSGATRGIRLGVTHLSP